MPIVLRRYFDSGRTPAGAEKEPVARLAGILAFGALTVAGGYFALLYLLTSR
jgi:hypothetical protein